MKKNTLALCAILKDEMSNLPRFMESFSGAVDEFHFTDTGSTDDSVAYLQKLVKEGYNGTPVYLHHFEWVDDFSKARNYSMSHTKADYILWADLDDALNNKEAFNLWRENAMSLSDYWMTTYNYGFDNGGKPACSFARERVFKRDRGFQWNYFIHEGVIPKSPLYPDIKVNYVQTWAIDHKRTMQEMTADRGRNLAILEKRKDKLDARMRFYLGKEYFDNGQHVEAIHWLLEGAKDPKCEPHDRLLALQYASFGYMQCNQFEKAIQISHQGLQLDSNRAEFYICIADAYLKLNQVVKAIPALHAAKGCIFQGSHNDAQLIFSSEACYTSYPREQLARVYSQVGQLDRGLLEAEEALTMGSSNAQAIIDEIKKIKNTSTVKKAADLKWTEDIIISAPPGTQMYEWDWDIAKERGIGGSETAAVQMAYHLHKLTGRKVKVFNGRAKSKECEGVEYVPNSEIYEYTNKYLPKLHVAWRHTIPLTEGPTCVWSHDLITPNIDKLTPNQELVCLSKFHCDYARAMQGVAENKIWISRNGIDPERFRNKEIKKQHAKIIWPGSPDRGLDWALQILDKVHKEIPEMELHIFYGVENMRKMGMNDQANKIEAEIKARPYTVYHGNQQQDVLADHFLESEVWLYSANFLETFCISALESIAAKCFPIVTGLAALRNTLGSYAEKGEAVIIDEYAESEAKQDLYVREVISAIKEKKWERMKPDLDAMSWKSVAEEWVTHFNLKNT